METIKLPAVPDFTGEVMVEVEVFNPEGLRDVRCYGNTGWMGEPDHWFDHRGQLYPCSEIREWRYIKKECEDDHYYYKHSDMNYCPDCGVRLS